MSWIETATPILFFTGKGGVGKTSLACVTAVALADRGKRVLLVSTDPASNLDHVFETTIAREAPRAVAGVAGLDALNIDPTAAAAAYRERVIGPVRGTLPAAVVATMEEQLSGACTTEIAAFDQFTGLLADAELNARYDHIVFDTAPTGHTLRLLELPAAWTHFLEDNTSGQSCLGPLSGLEAQREAYAAVVARLGDPQRTTLCLVARPDTMTLVEAARSAGELHRLGLANQRLLINGVFSAPPGDDPMAQAWVARQEEALRGLPAALAALPSDRVALHRQNMVGVAALRSLFVSSADAANLEQDQEALPTPAAADEASLDDLVTELAAAGHGLIMVMGKGGVGKTTLAAAIALALAERKCDVHLATTDPAAHLEQALADVAGSLSLSRIDPVTEVARYRAEVLAAQGAQLDAQGRALLEEDLRSPCTEEVAVFQAFSALVEEAAHRFVILDTAPTGHTLLLMDATGAYHREVERTGTDATGPTPLDRLRDPAYTRILIATLPETTPVLEAEQLEADLKRAGINTYGWIVNQSLHAGASAHPMLCARAANEKSVLDRVCARAARLALVPWLAHAPVGGAGLRGMYSITDGAPKARGQG